MTTTTGPQIFRDVAQMSFEWYELRRGIPTASCFDKILTPVTGKPSASQDDYIAELIADRQRLTVPYIPSDPEGYVNDEMAEGLRREPEARSWYAMERECELTQVGFVLSSCGRWGCSPDSLVGEDGVLELKNPAAKTHLKYLLKGTLPSEYKCQVHGQLIVTERAYCEFLSYCPGFSPFLVRVVPDGFTDLLRKALEDFHEKYMHTIELLKGM